MPKPSEILKALEKKAEAISAAIDLKQVATGKQIASAEKELFSLILERLFQRLKFDNDGKLINSTNNLAVLVQIDKAFEQFRKVVLKNVLSRYVSDLIEISRLTGEMYTGEASATILAKIAADNGLLLASIGVTQSGTVVKGSILWEISNSATVRQGAKGVVVAAIHGGFTFSELANALMRFFLGAKGATGRLQQFWRTYAYDLFNKAAEIKNEQFRRGLNLQWFLYVGDIIKDSRKFCVAKAGGVFAVIEADTEWPNDPDLVGKNSGIPYIPRIDRGRWNCRHRIRYITEGLAKQIDPVKVSRIKVKYGSDSV